MPKEHQNGLKVWTLCCGRMQSPAEIDGERKGSLMEGSAMLQGQQHRPQKSKPRREEAPSEAQAASACSVKMEGESRAEGTDVRGSSS